MLDRSPDADRRQRRRERQRRYRERQRAGVLSVVVEVTASEVDKLVRLRNLGEQELEDRRAIGAEIAALLRAIVLDA